MDPVRKENIDAKAFLNERRRMLNEFKKFTTICSDECSLYALHDIKWKFEEYKGNRSFLTNNYNCGIFVIYFMDCLG